MKFKKASHLTASSLRFVLALASAPLAVFSQSPLNCGVCHQSTQASWAASVHAKTQTDVAAELSQSHPGETPDGVVQAEDCIACHAPTGVLANGGMTEGQALGFFFSTSNGQFAANTQAAHPGLWPQVGCLACHDVPANHPDSPTRLALFNSQTGHYIPLDSPSKLCGQCHGNLHFADTDHQIYNAWAGSKHGGGQTDVAGELGQAHAGETPDDVTQAEDCIACHAPTAVLANGGMSEGQALAFFFGTRAGQFATDTLPANGAAWPGVSCTACHNPHGPGKLSFFNSSTKQYQAMSSPAELCGQCHGNLRFKDTDHLSYNIVGGAGGIGVANQLDMATTSCVDCHMFSSDTDGTNSKMFHGHSWGITVPEVNGQNTSSCTHCHASMDAAAANAAVLAWKSEFQTLDAAAQANVTRAAAAMQGSQPSAFVAALQEAQHNLAYAESDESGGFHNHKFVMALLNDAKAKSLSLPILNAARQGSNVIFSWTGSGALQSAPSLRGPWSDVPGATNPFTISPSGDGDRFYRLRL